MSTDLHELADVATALDWLSTPEMAKNVRCAIDEIDRLREVLIGLDQRIWTDPQVIERAGEWRELIRDALAPQQDGRM